MGRGSFSYIGDVSEVKSKMTALFEKLKHPVISDVTVESPQGGMLEMYPQPMPDLYYGEPISALIKSDGALDTLLVRGKNMGRPWSVELDAAAGKERAGVSTLWARKKIRSLMEALNTGAAEEEVSRQILETALAHKLVSKYTSLVAVEQEVSRPATDKLDNQQIKTNLPQGWQHRKVFGGAAKTATNSHRLLFAGLVLFLLSLIMLRKRKVTI
jgi:Ca-activated chloride channel family protein